MWPVDEIATYCLDFKTTIYTLAQALTGQSSPKLVLVVVEGDLSSTLLSLGQPLEDLT